MSANDVLIIRELGKGVGWAVEQRDIETDYLIDCIALQPTLRRAVEQANGFIKEHPLEVEYGIRIILSEGFRKRKARNQLVG
jgi:hypothetical protein